MENNFYGTHRDFYFIYFGVIFVNMEFSLKKKLFYFYNLYIGRKLMCKLSIHITERMIII